MLKLMMVKVIFEVLFVPNKRVFRILVNYVIIYLKFFFLLSLEIFFIFLNLFFE